MSSPITSKSSHVTLQIKEIVLPPSTEAMVKIHLKIAQIAMQKSDWPLAEKSLRKVLELDPKNKESSSLITEYVKKSGLGGKV